MRQALPVRRDWSLRVIPLPHEIDVTGELEVRRDEVGLDWQRLGSPLDEIIPEVLRVLAPGGPDCRFVVRPRIVIPGASPPPAGPAGRLEGLPNADQAYAVVSSQGGAGGQIDLFGLTPLALLYAARTLVELCAPPGSEAESFALPLGVIVDWPDLGERGQWGGNTADALPAMAALKLNAWAVHAWPGADETGVPRIKLDARTVESAARLGIRAVPIFIHLEQLSTQGMKGWEDCFNTPDAERAARSDYVPGLCLSKARTRELIAALLELIAALPGVRGVDFCLSEEWTPCLCPECAGREPFLLEIEAILAAYRKVKIVHPELHLRVETSQGSHAVNDRIVAMLPREVGVQYYDGGRTYSSTHAPIIPPVLSDYASRGGWLGVCAQITNSWRSTLPWTGPHFIHARMAELAEKKLSYFIGYAVPANHFHELSVAAAAEWSWNHAGRSPCELARAFALRRGIRDPELYADWAELIGPVGWDIAASRLYLGLIYDPTFGMDKGVPLDHRFEGGPEVLDARRIELDLARAGDALRLAQRLELPEAVEETEIDIASLHLIITLYALSHLSPTERGPKAAREVASLLDTLDHAAAVVSTRLRSWGERICRREGLPMPSRLCDTAQSAPRAANIARERFGRAMGIADPHPAQRYREIGRWSASDFDPEPRRTLAFDATPIIDEPGEYAVCLDFLPGLHGLNASNIRITELDSGHATRVFPSTDLMERVSMWVASAEVTVKVDGIRRGATYRVELDAEGPEPGLEAERRSCNGRVSLRRHWPRSTPGL